MEKNNMFYSHVSYIFTACMLTIVTRADTGLNCTNYMDTIDSKDLSGYLANSFLILATAEETELQWNNYCMVRPDSKLISSSQGIRIQNKGVTFNVFSVIKDQSQVDGTAVVMFSEIIKLDYSILHSYTPVIPLNKLGTEYFFVFAISQSQEYVAKICSINNITDIVIEVLNAERNVSDQKIGKKLSIHETFAIRRKFDFSGSRILSTIKVAVLCFSISDFDFSDILIPNQLLPSNMFGSIYYYMYDQICEKLCNDAIRLLAMFSNTTVATSIGYDVIMTRRGEIVDISVISGNVITLTSDKHFIVFVTLNAGMPISVVPAEQYTRQTSTYPTGITIVNYKDDLMEFIDDRGIKPLFQSCKLMEVGDCRGKCNQTLVDSCEYLEDNRDADLVYALSDTAGSGKSHFQTNCTTRRSKFISETTPTRAGNSLLATIVGTTIVSAAVVISIGLVALSKYTKSRVQRRQSVLPMSQ